MILDIIAVIILLISTAIAVLRGFVRELLTIVGVIGGTVASWALGPLLSPHMLSWITDDSIEEGEKLFDIVPYEFAASSISYGVIFVTVMIILTIISHLMSTSVKAMGLGAVDRSLGALFGIARAVLVIALLYLPVQLFADDEQKENWFGASQSRLYVEMATDIIARHLPTTQEETDEQVTTSTDTLRKILEDQDVLKKIEQQLDDTQEQPTQKNNTEDGYENNQRQQLDKLLKEELFNE